MGRKRVSGVLIFSVALLLLALSLSSCIKIPKYKIDVENVVHYTGKWSYITVTVKDFMGNPAEGIGVALSMDYSGTSIRFKTSGSTARVSVDPIAYTDSNGVAVFEGYYVSSGEYDYRVYLADDPDIERAFHVTVEPVEWLFMVYLGADNNLEGAGYTDLGEMETSKNNVAVVGIADVSESEYDYFTNDFYFMLDERGEMYTEDVGAEVDSGSPAELEQFLEDFYSIEANHKALVLWNHGYAWLDEEPRTKGIIYDDTDGTFLRIKEVEEVLETVLGDNKLDILGMDACLMSTVEVAYQLRNTADYFVASAFSEPGDGWDYNFLDEIPESSEPYDVAKNIVDTYFEGLTDDQLSLAVWKLEYMDALYLTIDDFARELDQELTADLKTKILDTYPTMTQYYEGVLCDLADFINFVMYSEDISTDVNNSAMAVLWALYDALPYYQIRGAGSYSRGASIFLPGTYDAYDYFHNAFGKLDFGENYWGSLVYHIVH